MSTRSTFARVATRQAIVARDERRAMAPVFPPLRRWRWRRIRNAAAWIAYALAWAYGFWWFLDEFWGAWGGR